MDLRDSPAEATFRAQVRAWLEESVPPGYDPDDWEWRLPADERFRLQLAWHRKLHAGGWVGLSWPKEYGGQGAPVALQLIFAEESARLRLPRGVCIIGLSIVGPTLAHVGSEEQKRRYLPPLLSGDEIWCQGFSEPDAGSDLASLRTRAEDRGDHFVVTGQKVWTSFAQHARWCWLLARTRSESRKHDGLSMMVVDMRAPGVEVRPLVQLTGDSDFNEIFFDGARVPKENLVGAQDDGWRVAVATLMFERYGIGLDLRKEWLLRRLGELARETGRVGDAEVRTRLAKLWCDYEACRLTTFRHMTRLGRGEAAGQPGPEGSLSKLVSSEIELEVGALAEEMLGLAGTIAPGQAGAPDGGRWARVALGSRYMTIAGGTSEIQRNIIAERVLGLPKGR